MKKSEQKKLVKKKQKELIRRAERSLNKFALEERRSILWSLLMGSIYEDKEGRTWLRNQYRKHAK